MNIGIAASGKTETNDELSENYEDLTFADGYDDCIVGIVTQFGRDPIVCYDYNKVLANLMTQGMSEDEALEFFEFNILGAWVGEATPCFLDTSLIAEP